jgi:molecular chaperone Hsp33
MTVLADDFSLPFEIDRTGLRGRIVRLCDQVDNILQRHAYPPVIATLLGEALALAACLASTVKFDDGIFTLQARGGGGPVRFLVADITSEGALRGYVGFDAERLGEFADEQPSTARLFGGGHLAFTVDQGGDFERYQGIVELAGESLADSVHHYFRQSEQIASGLKLACAPDPGGRWRASALMVQKLPDETIRRAAPEDVADLVETDEGFRRAVTLLGSATIEEMIDSELSAEALLYRLFHEDGVRVYDKSYLVDRCRCQLDRVEDVLRQFGRERIDEFKVDGIVTVTCEFCANSRVFDEAALDELGLE